MKNNCDNCGRAFARGMCEQHFHTVPGTSEMRTLCPECSADTDRAQTEQAARDQRHASAVATIDSLDAAGALARRLDVLAGKVLAIGERIEAERKAKREDGAKTLPPEYVPAAGCDGCGNAPGERHGVDCEPLVAPAWAGTREATIAKLPADIAATIGATAPEPPPLVTGSEPIWPLVIADAEHLGCANLVTDMKARDAFGRAKYGTPLTADNGRDHLADAYQEVLDEVVYLRAAVEQGRDVGGLYHEALAHAVKLRGVLDGVPAGPTRAELLAACSPATRTFLAAVKAGGATVEDPENGAACVRRRGPGAGAVGGSRAPAGAGHRAGDRGVAGDSGHLQGARVLGEESTDRRTKPTR